MPSILFFLSLDLGLDLGVLYLHPSSPRIAVFSAHFVSIVFHIVL